MTTGSNIISCHGICDIWCCYLWLFYGLPARRLFELGGLGVSPENGLGVKGAAKEVESQLSAPTRAPVRLASIQIMWLNLNAGRVSTHLSWPLVINNS